MNKEQILNILQGFSDLDCRIEPYKNTKLTDNIAKALIYIVKAEALLQMELDKDEDS